MTAHLRSDAQKLTKELWDIIKPHFDSLSTLAQLYDLSSPPNSELSLQDVFEEQITAIVEAALLYRLKLLASGRNHVHIWPKTDDAYDVAEMEILGAQEARKELQVLFTVFPGTKLAMPGSGDLEAEPKTQATVTVKLLARKI